MKESVNYRILLFVQSISEVGQNYFLQEGLSNEKYGTFREIENVHETAYPKPEVEDPIPLDCAVSDLRS